MFEKMIPNDSFGRISDRYNNPWGFPKTLGRSIKAISREQMPIGVSVCSDAELDKGQEIDVDTNIVEKPQEEQTHDHGIGEASGTVSFSGTLGERKSKKLKEKANVHSTVCENELSDSEDDKDYKGRILMKKDQLKVLI